MREREQNLHIQGLRAVAAMLVFGYHLILKAQEVKLLPDDVWLGFGQAGVDLFFLISGYLVWRMVRDAPDLSNFVVRRLTRVVPLLLITNLVVAATNTRLGSPPDPFVFLSSCLMLPGMFDLGVIQGPAWSLSYEMTFYLGAAMFAWTRRRDAGFLSMLGFALVVLIVLFHPRFVFLLIGASMASVRPAAAGQAGLTATAAVAAVMLVSLVVAIGRGDAITANMLELDPFLYAGSLLAGTLAFRMVLSMSADNLLTTRPLQYVGKISYSIYLWHGFLLFHAWSYVQPRTPVTFMLFAAVMLLVTLGISHLSHRVIEDDLRHRLLALWAFARQRTAEGR